MHVSVILPTANRPEHARDALASVLGGVYPAFDLLVVDQSDDPGTERLVRELMARDPRVSYRRGREPGLARARNLGIRETWGEPLAFIDDECRAAPDWLEAIVGAFCEQPDADLLYGQVLLPVDGPDCGEWLALSIPRPRRLSRRDGCAFGGTGANFALRRRLVARIGGFDEGMGGNGPARWAQDLDFQLRTYLAGAVILLRPEVRVERGRARPLPPAWAPASGDGALPGGPPA